MMRTKIIWGVRERNSKSHSKEEVWTVICYYPNDYTRTWYHQDERLYRETETFITSQLKESTWKQKLQFLSGRIIKHRNGLIVKGFDLPSYGPLRCIQITSEDKFSFSYWDRLFGSSRQKSELPFWCPWPSGEGGDLSTGAFPYYFQLSINEESRPFQLQPPVLFRNKSQGKYHLMPRRLKHRLEGYLVEVLKVLCLGQVVQLHLWSSRAIFVST